MSMGETPWIAEVPLMTIGDLRVNHLAYVENGEQKKDASKYLNVVNKPLVVGDDHELLIDKMGIPELHVLTGSIEQFTLLIPVIGQFLLILHTHL